MGMEASGGKDKGLEWLLENRHGYEVPRFESVGTSGPMKQILSDSYAAAKRIGGTIIVRSNSLHEDGTHSFAGVYRSVEVLSPTREGIAGAVHDVMDSFSSQRAQQYRRERGITDDRIGLIVQRFVEPEFSGVMYTSNPQFPSDLSIELFSGRINDASQPYIFDFGKESGELVFASENSVGRHDFYAEHEDLVQRLYAVGVYIEGKALGARDVEFVVRDGTIYLVQARPITDMRELIDVVIPGYDPSQFIAASSVSRGNGSLTLPVVRMQPYEEAKLVAAELFAMGEMDAMFDFKRNWLDDLIGWDETFSDGYVLIAPYFTDFIIDGFERIGYDDLTPNKKAIITTQLALRTSHALTIAREKDVAYAGFLIPGAFDDVRAGDVISMYFKGRTAEVYREQQESLDVRTRFPPISFRVEQTEHGPYFYASGMRGGAEQYADDLIGLLRGMDPAGEWKYEKGTGPHQAWTYTNKDGEGLVMMMASNIGGNQWSLNTDAFAQRLFDFTPLPDERLSMILDAYIAHLS